MKRLKLRCRILTARLPEALRFYTSEVKSSSSSQTTPLPRLRCLSSPMGMVSQPSSREASRMALPLAYRTSSCPLNIRTKILTSSKASIRSSNVDLLSSRHTPTKKWSGGRWMMRGRCLIAQQILSNSVILEMALQRTVTRQGVQCLHTCGLRWIVVTRARRYDLTLDLEEAALHPRDQACRHRLRDRGRVALQWVSNYRLPTRRTRNRGTAILTRCPNIRRPYAPV